MQHNQSPSQDKCAVASDALVAAFIRTFQRLGTGVLRYGLVGILFFWEVSSSRSPKPKRSNHFSLIRR